jgi:hypothetical protein
MSDDHRVRVIDDEEVEEEDRLIDMVHSPNPAHPTRLIPSDQVSIRSSNSSVVREEQRRRQLFPEGFEHVPQHMTASPVPSHEEDSSESPGDDETTSPLSEDMPKTPARTEIPHAVVRRFQEQDARRSQFMIQVGGQQQRQLADAEFVGPELTRWYGRCWICHQSGADEWHALQDCPQSEGQIARQWAHPVQMQVRYSPYSGCFDCGLPKAICQQWVSDGRRRWVKKPGQMCQFPKGKIISMVAGMLHRRGEVRAAWMRWLRQWDVDGQQLDQVITFFGQRATSGTWSGIIWWLHFVGCGDYCSDRLIYILVRAAVHFIPGTE